MRHLAMGQSWSWKAVFRPRPKQFGLRGDDCAWDAVAGVMPSCKAPVDSDEAMSMILEVFERITDIDLREPAPDEGHKVPLFRDEGMSGSFVSPQWWNERLLPLLKGRIERQLRRLEVISQSETSAND